MAIRDIVISGEPVLHRPSLAVTKFDAELQELVADMFETTDAAPGVGLAAPQVGIDAQVFVWVYEDQDEAPARGVAVNPELWITPLAPGAPTVEDEEGCLSFPGERFPLRRADRALLRAFDLVGKPFEIQASGWFARILQHEYDHLQGLLYIDRLGPHDAKSAAKVLRREKWGVPGLSWTPGIDQLEG